MKPLTFLFISLLFTIALSAYDLPTGCTPFGVRLALGRNYWTSTENETLSIRFNTRLECPKSHITIEQS